MAGGVERTATSESPSSPVHLAPSGRQVMPKITLYLGAHKTATTHLQGMLGLGRAWLAGRGIALSLPQDLRKTWLPGFFTWVGNQGRTSIDTLTAELREIMPISGRWIVAEENILGVSNDLMTRAGLYPMAGERLLGLMQLFEQADIELFFSIRSYADFYRSAYSEVVRNRGYVPFSQFYDESRFAGNSWLQMVRDLQQHIPEEKMTLWCYEDFRSLLPTLVQLITGEESVEELLAFGSNEPTRPSLSHKTMEILGLLDPVLSRKETLALVERINRAYPVSQENRVFDPFTPGQKAAMHARYLEDVARIREEFPRLRFLGAAH